MVTVVTAPVPRITSGVSTPTTLAGVPGSVAPVGSSLPVTTTTLPTEDQIKQAIQDYLVAYFACGQKPAECDPEVAMAPGGPGATSLDEFRQALVDREWRFDTDIHGTRLVVTKVVMFGAEGAEVTSCIFDAGVLLGPDGPDGKPTVVNDEAKTSTYVHHVRLVEGRWRVWEQLPPVFVGEGDLCGPVS